MTVPVAVVVPHQRSRAWFFNEFCLPSIMANDPGQLIVEDWEGGAPEKRNAGAEKARERYLIFVDDDTILPNDFLSTMVEALEADGGAGYAYSDFVRIGWPERQAYPVQPVQSRPFDAQALRKENFIDTTSVMRREAFIGFDPRLKRFQDWDLWLSLMKKGVTGLYVPGPRFMKFSLDAGISGTVPCDEAMLMIRFKHSI